MVLFYKLRMERIKEAIQVCLEADKEEIMPLKFIGVQQ
ncbi:Uncharacterised protein [uncultured archaeon]|nr:Uncharacterised protein [uncultured archaeon]